MAGASLQSIRLVHRKGTIELGPANIMISLKHHTSAEHDCCSMVAMQSNCVFPSFFRSGTHVG
eukprot:scaffold67383_cov51-Attheya_sp.AAC.3